jgi:Concanavalin A-like lectin/glucanases superfamily/PA domain/Putative metal-binding motif
MGINCRVLNRMWLIGLLFILMNQLGFGQINYSLNCVGGFSCNGESDGSVSVILTETQRQLHIASISNHDFIYAPALFGPDIYINALSGELKYFSNPDLGCSAYPASTFSGKIAVIDRGTCSFESKVLNAQNAGAVGAIIVNNAAGSPFPLGGNNLLGVTIPTVMISQSDGVILKNLLAMPAVVNGSTPQYTYQWSCGSTMPSVSGLKEGIYTVTVLANNDDTLSCSTQVLANNRSINIVTNSSIINCAFDTVDLSVSAFNNAIAMNGTNQWINLNSNVTNLNNASFTLEAWINTSSGSEGIIVSSNSNNVWEAGERAFFIDDIGRITFSGFDNGSITSSVEVDDGFWHHVAVVWDYSVPPGAGKIYIDGFDRTATMNYSASASANIGVFKIGRSNYSGTQAPNFYDGKIDEVRIWSIARSGLDIRTGMVNAVAANTPGLLSYFKFDETSGSTVLNASNNLANGSFVNAVDRVDALTYLWTPTGDTVPAISVNVPGEYSVSVKDYFGCAAVSTPVFINSVGVNPSGPLTICSGDSVLLDAGENMNPVYGFSEFFDVSTWATVHSPNDMGSVNTNSSPNSISILSSNSNVGGSPVSYIDYCHVMNGDGMLNFNWSFSSATSPQSDYPEVILNGNSASLQNFVYGSGGASNQSGAVSIPVLKNQNFCFRMNTTNNQGGAATLTISNIRFPDSYSSYLWSTGATTQMIKINAAGNYSVSVSTSNGCTVVSLPVVVSVNSNSKSNWYADSDGDGFGDATLDSLYCFQPAGFVSNDNDCNDTLNYIHPNAYENCFNAIDDNCNLIIDEGCGVGDFQLKVLFEGYMLGGGLMIPYLFNNGLNPDPNTTDSITVQLRAASSPYTMIQSNQEVLFRNGFVSIPGYPSNGSYYIVVKSRNGIETWSKTPVLFDGGSVFYDFSK